MANRELKVELTVEDRKLISGLKHSLNIATTETKKATMDMKKSWANYKMAVLGVVAAIGTVAYTVKKLVDLYAEQEQAELDLAAAMKINGSYTLERWKAYKKFASEMQQITTYGDESILQAMANLQTYGIKSEQTIKRATQAVLDLAAAKKIDLRTASEIVGKAFTGETGTLTRYGIVIDKGLDKTEKFDAVLNKIAETMGGRAKAAAESLNGQLTQMKNLLGDVGEQAVKAGSGLMTIAGQKLGGWQETRLKDAETKFKNWLKTLQEKLAETQSEINKKAIQQEITEVRKALKNIERDQKLLAQAGGNTFKFMLLKVKEALAGFNEWVDKEYDNSGKIDKTTKKIKTRTQAIQEYKAVIDELSTASADKLFSGEIGQFDLPNLKQSDFTGMIRTQEEYLNSIRKTWWDTVSDIEDAMGGWDNVMAQFGGDIAGNLFDLAYAHELSAGAIIQSMVKLAAGVIQNIVKQSAIKAIYELAEGLSLWANGNPRAASLHFAAAGKYAAIAGVGIVAGGLLGGMASSGSRNDARTGAVGGGAVFTTVYGTTSYTGGIQQNQTQVTIVNVVDKQSYLGLMASPEGQNVIVNSVSLDYAKNGTIRRVIRGGI